MFYRWKFVKFFYLQSKLLRLRLEIDNVNTLIIKVVCFLITFIVLIMTNVGLLFCLKPCYSDFFAQP